MQEEVGARDAGVTYHVFHLPHRQEQLPAQRRAHLQLEIRGEGAGLEACPSVDGEVDLVSLSRVVGQHEDRSLVSHVAHARPFPRLSPAPPRISRHVRRNFVRPPRQLRPDVSDPDHHPHRLLVAHQGPEPLVRLLVLPPVPPPRHSLPLVPHVQLQSALPPRLRQPFPLPRAVLAGEVSVVGRRLERVPLVAVVDGAEGADAVVLVDDVGMQHAPQPPLDVEVDVTD
eukprot:768560-Hanusia_phi.AAC.8